MGRRLSLSTLLLLIFCLHSSDAGRQVSVNTTSDHADYILNDLGINVKAGTLVFDVTSTQDAIIRLTKTHTLTGTKCDVILGSVSNTAIAVRESCGGCNSVIAAYGTFLDPSIPTNLWLDWRDGAHLIAGRGDTVGESVEFTYTWTQPFEVNYAAVTSYYGNEGQWNFLIDTPPQITDPSPDGSTVISIQEDWPINTTVTKLTAVDSEGDSIVYHVIGQHFNFLNIINDEIYLTQALDFEQEEVLIISLIASDGRHNTTAILTLQVLDVIDETPTLAMGPVTSVPEELPVGSDVIGLFSAEDKDKEDNLTYTLKGNDKSYFSINETSGEITVASRLDRDGGLLHLDDLSVMVTDSAGLIAELSLNLTVDDVNDNRPRFGNDTYTLSVTALTSSDTPLLVFNVTDDDSADNGNVTLELLTSHDAFWISSMALYVNVTLLLSASQPVHTLAVQARDGCPEPRTLTSVCIVHVQVLWTNQHDPVWTQPTVNASGWFPELMVNESVAMGTVLVRISATDDDVGLFGDVSYDLASVQTDQAENATHRFFLDPMSGELRTSNVLDRDTATGGAVFFLMTFRVVDSGSRSAEAKIKVTLVDENDNAPVFNQSLYSVKLPCDSKQGTKIATLEAFDVDDASAVTFTIDDGRQDYFSVDGTNGDVNLLRNSSELSALANSHILTVSVKDGGQPELTSSALVVITVDSCSTGTINSNDTKVSDLPSTNEILIVVSGILGGLFLLTTIFIFVRRDNLTKSVAPSHQELTSRAHKDMVLSTSVWAQRGHVDTTHPSPNSLAMTGSSANTELTDCSSLNSLEYV